jgi:hypothetical protein
MPVPTPHVTFVPETMLIVPDAPYVCTGAYFIPNRDRNGIPQVICNLLMGDRIQTTDGTIPTHGRLKAAAVVLSPSDARALARELEKYADEAERT